MLLWDVSIAEDKKYNATVIMTEEQRYIKVQLQSIENDNVRIKAPYMKDEGLALPRKQIQKIIFKGGKEDSRGIVFKNGVVLNGSVAEYINGTWKLTIEGLDGILELKDNQISSINFKEPAFIITKNGDENWKYHASVNVLEWIYTNTSKLVFDQATVPYSLEIEKLSLASNQLILHAYVYSEEFTTPKRGHCYVGCTLDDDKRNQYEPIFVKIGYIPNKAGKKKLLISCPNPKENVEHVIISLTTNDNVKAINEKRPFKPKGRISVSYHHQCGKEEWKALPAFSMELLR